MTGAELLALARHSRGSSEGDADTAKHLAVALALLLWDLTPEHKEQTVSAATTRRFINEVGNEITIEVAFGDPGKLCRLAIIGPDGSIESYVTPLELRALHSSLNELLGNG